MQPLLFFDLKAKPREGAGDASGETTTMGQAQAFEYVGDGLLEALGGYASHPFDHFKLLLGLHQEGLLQDKNSDCPAQNRHRRHLAI